MINHQHPRIILITSNKRSNDINKPTTVITMVTRMITYWLFLLLCFTIGEDLIQRWHDSNYDNNSYQKDDATILFPTTSTITTRISGTITGTTLRTITRTRLTTSSSFLPSSLLSSSILSSTSRRRRRRIIMFVSAQSSSSSQPNCYPCINRSQYTIKAIIHGNTDVWQQSMYSMKQAALDFGINLIVDMMNTSILYDVNNNNSFLGASNFIDDDNIYTPINQNMSASLYTAMNDTSIDAIIITIPNDVIADTVQSIRQTNKPIFGFNVGSNYFQNNVQNSNGTLSSNTILQGFINSGDDTISGQIAAYEFFKYFNKTSKIYTINLDDDNVSITPTDEKSNETSSTSSLLRTAVYVDSILESEYTRKYQYMSFGKTLQEYGISIIARIVIDPRNNTEHERLINILFIQGCPYQAILLTNELSMEYAINASRNSQCENITKIGITTISTNIYKEITNDNILFGLDQQIYIQSIMSIMFTSLYITTGMRIPLPAQNNDNDHVFLSGPVVINSKNVPSDTKQACQNQAYPICSTSSSSATSLQALSNTILNNNTTNNSSISIYSNNSSSSSSNITSLGQCECIDRSSIRIAGVVHGTSDSIFWLSVYEASLQAAADLGVILDMTLFEPNTNQTFIQEEQMSARIQTLCESGNIDGIFITLPGSINSSLVDSVKICQTLNIPIISINAGADISSELNLLHHIAQIEYNAGYDAGIKLIELGMKYGYCLDHEIGNNVMIERCQGFENAINTYMNSTTAGINNNTVVTYMGRFNVPSDNKVLYKKNVESYVGSNNDTDVDWNGIGLLSLGLTPLASAIALVTDHSNVLIGTFDFNSDVNDYILDGVLQFGIDQQQYYQGIMPVYMLTYYSYTKQTLLNHKFNTGGLLITKPLNDNVNYCYENNYQVCTINDDNNNDNSTDIDDTTSGDDTSDNNNNSLVEASPIVKLSCDSCIKRNSYILQTFLYGNNNDTYVKQVSASMMQATKDMGIQLTIIIDNNYNILSQKIRAASFDTNINGLIVMIPNDIIATTVQEITISLRKPIFGFHIGYQLSKSMNIQGFVGQNDNLAGQVAAEQFILYYNSTTSSLMTDTTTDGNNKTLLQTAVYVESITQFSISANEQFESFNRTLQEQINDIVVERITVDPLNTTLHEEQINELFTNCQYQAVVLGSDVSLALAIYAKSDHDCTDTQIGVIDSNKNIYQAITNKAILFGIDQERYIQAAFSVILASLYVTTDKKLSLPRSIRAYLSKARAINSDNVPTDSDQSCEAEAYPIKNGYEDISFQTGNCDKKDRSQFRIGGVLHGVTTDTFWEPVFASAKQAAIDVGVDLDLTPFEPQSDPNVLYEQMASKISSLCASYVKGIFVTIPSDIVIESIKQCQKLNIPVISINAGAKTSEELGLYNHIAQSEFVAGYEAGQRMILDGMITGYCPDHAYGNPATAERCLGFADAINKTNGAVLYGGTFQVPDDNIEQYKLIVETQINDPNGDWDGIGLLSLGPKQIEALHQLANIHPRVIVGTFDVSTDIKDSIKEGWLKFGIDQQAFLQGALPVYLLTYLAYTSGQSIWNQNIESGPSFVTTAPTTDEEICEANFYKVCVIRDPEDMNLIPIGLLGFGYALFSLIAAMCIGTGIWVYRYRNEWIVKVSQPPLLGMVLVGCLVSSLSILFLGVQTGYRYVQDEITREETNVPNSEIYLADASCMAVPWLYGMGFVVIFSALFAKIQRVKMIYAAGKRMQRKTIGLSDVIYIMAFLLAIEFTILISWQLIAPLKWVRDFTIDDIEGYTTVSVGGCNYEESWYFYVILVAFHVICLFYALALCFQTRHINSDFAESSYISLAVAFMFQVLVLAVPISSLVRDTTHVFYFIRVCAIFLQNFTVLALIFIPKMIRHHGASKVDRSGSSANLSGTGKKYINRLMKSTCLKFSHDNFTSGIRQSESKHFKLEDSMERRSSNAVQNSLEEQISFLTIEEHKPEPLFVVDSNVEDSTRTRTAEVDMFLKRVAQHGDRNNSFADSNNDDDDPDFISAPFSKANKGGKNALESEKTETTKETESSRDFDSTDACFPPRHRRWQVPNVDDALHDNLTGNGGHQQDIIVNPDEMDLVYITTIPTDDVYISHPTTTDPESELPLDEMKNYRRRSGVDRGDTKPDEEFEIGTRSADYGFTTTSDDDNIFDNNNGNSNNGLMPQEESNNIQNDWRIYGFQSEDQATSVLSFLSSISPEERYNLLTKFGGI